MTHEHHVPGPPDPLTGLPAPSTGADAAPNQALRDRTSGGRDERGKFLSQERQHVPPFLTGGSAAPEAPATSSASPLAAVDAPTVPHDQRPALGYALYLLASLLFGINGTVSKVVLQAVDDTARVSQLRVTFAFLLLLLVVALTRPRSIPLHRAELGPVAAYGVLGVAMTQWLYFVAISRMQIGIALLIEFTAPIMVVLWVRFAWHRPVRNSVWLGLALALLGLAMVAQIWGGLSLDSLGVAAALGAAVALALYYLLGESAGQHRDPVSLTLWGFGFAALMWAVVLPWWRFPWGSLSGSATPFGAGTTPLPLWALATSMVVLGTIVPFWLVLAAIRHIGAAGASIIGMIEPFIASLVAWVVLGEVLVPIQIVGGIVILTGVVIAERARG